MAVSLPAAGQGALGIECLANASDIRALLEPLDDPRSGPCVRAERGVSAGLGADCSAPLAAHAEMDADDNIALRAVIAAPDGSVVLRAAATGRDPAVLADAVVAELRAAGAARILTDRH